MTDTYTELMNDGPKPATDINKPTPQMRRDGLQKFNPRVNHVGSPTHGGGMKTPVYYIAEKHNPETVIRVWLNANEKTVEEVSEWALHQRISSYGEEWKDASYDILEASAHNGEYHGDGSTDVDACPMCGVEVDFSLSRHLPECDGA